MGSGTPVAYPSLIVSVGLVVSPIKEASIPASRTWSSHTLSQAVCTPSLHGDGHHAVVSQATQGCFVSPGSVVNTNLDRPLLILRLMSRLD